MNVGIKQVQHEIVPVLITLEKADRKQAVKNERNECVSLSWDAEHGDSSAERERFAAEILPKLTDMPLKRIIEATGLSLRYVWMPKKGQYVLRPVDYAGLQAVVADRETYESLNSSQ